MKRIWQLRILLTVAALALAGCVQAARVFLDLPEAAADQQNAELAQELIRQLTEGPPPPPPPPIESVMDPDSVLAMLPADASGGIDWVEAQRAGVIRPRSGERDAGLDTLVGFSYDIYLSSEGGPEAFFPHSTHRSVLGCESCHPRVYRGGGGVGEAHEERSCGYCHGPVAFPIQSCERCHADATDLPEARRDKVLCQVVQMERDSANTGGAFEGFDLRGDYPPAQFPHGKHRLRYQCRACHESPFPMVRGATVLARDDAHAEAGCGRCHDGVTAFGTGLDDCNQCHIEAGG
jgi:c(7)-type cytochrome triheme protein